MSGRLGLRAHAARIALAPLVGAIAFLAFPRAQYRVPELAAGSVTDAAVIAPVRFLVLKDDAIRAREAEELAGTIPPIITVRREAAAASARTAAAFFARLDSAAAAGGSVAQVAREAGITLLAEEAAALAQPSMRRRWAAGVTRAVGSADLGYLAPGLAAADLGRQVVMRERGAERTMPADSVGTFSDFLVHAGSQLPLAGPVPEGLFVKLVGAFFEPTLVYERDETERRRDALRRTVDSVESVVLAGQKVVDAHEVVTERDVRRLDALRRAVGGVAVGRAGAWIRAASGLGLNTLIVGLFGVICLLYRPDMYRDMRALSACAAGFAIVAIIGGLLAHNAPGRVELIPVALPAILIAVLFDGRIAAVAAMTLAALVGVQPALRGSDALFVTFAGGVAAALSMRRIRSRTQVYRSILVVAALYAAAAAIVGGAGGRALGDIGISAAYGGVNAMASAALAMLILPIAETFTRSTTDLKLLELADPHHPLLRRLATEAPGTYAHSVALANLCEAACEAIGANGLLARVGCYYHDIGKLKHPQFFVENLGHGKNPHAQLSAAQSATIIRRHVDEGVAFARAHGLPEAIARFIPEHHGTLTISYFLERAREEKNGIVREEDFRYAGPLPQTAETAVALLGDSVEAALRVLDEPTPETIADAIDHLVAQRVEAGQLREAPLTLRQIAIVQREFVRVLTGVYHTRVEYPEEAGGITADWEHPRVA